MKSANPEITRAFLAAVAPGEAEFTFQTFDDGKAKRPELARVVHGALDDVFHELTCLSALGAGVFVTINRTDLRGRKTENVIAVRAVFVDLDGVDSKNLLRLGLRPSIIVQSSPGHFHVYWCVSDFRPPEFSLIQKRLAALIDGDKCVNDLSRVMRLPGFLHQKGEPWVVAAYFPPKPARYRNAAFLSALEAAELRHGIGKAARVRPPVYTGSSTANKLANTAAAAPCTPAELARLQSALAAIPADDRTVWLQVGMGLHWTGWGSPSRKIWDDWSRNAPEKFDEVGQDRTWRSFDRPLNGQKITLATIYALAKELDLSDLKQCKAR